MPLVLALGLGASGCAGEGLDDSGLGLQQEYIIGGGTVSEQNRHDIGLVDVNDFSCSGSVLDTNWVVTATHCIDFAHVANNTFGVPRAPIASGIEVRHARRAVRMDQSDVTLVELEPIPDISQGIVIWPTVHRHAYAGEIDALKNTSTTCYGHGGSGYQNGGGLTFDGWHSLTRTITDFLNGQIHFVADHGSLVTAPGDSGGMCAGTNGDLEAVVSNGSWNCSDLSTQGTCKQTITEILTANQLIVQPWAGIINAISGKKPLALWNDRFSDAGGWNEAKYYSTIQFADINGDGRADLCGRGGGGISCAVSSNDSGFTGTKRWQTSFSDADGWAVGPEYYSTIHFPDVNGDGKADVCGRGGDGIWCATSDGSSFTNISRWDSAFSDANGWRDPKYYTTIRFVDVNGDRKTDVCGRGGAGVYCALSTGFGFTSPTLWVGTFSDAGGWGDPQYYSTIQFPDLNGDGMADVCGRGGSGISCALSNGTSAFTGMRRWNTAFSDANGWGGGPEYYSTIRFPDVNGDGMADVCGRGGAGIYCALSNGSSAFTGTSLWIANFNDANAWNSGPQYYSTIRFTDLDADGRMDVCGRGAAGMYCAASNGTSFAGMTLWDDRLSDAGGWNAPEYYSTIAFPDIDSDFHSELCGRGAAGIYCEK